MESIHATTNQAYPLIVQMLRDQQSQSSRAGGTREKLGVAVRSPDPRDRIMMRPKINWAFGLQESFAYYSGQNPGHVERYNTQMKNYMTDGKLEGSAYGRYLRHIPHDQIERVISQLRENEATRQAVINFHQSGVERYDGPDVACTVYLQFIAREGELNLIAAMRSQDMLFGYPYDVQAFQWLQEVIAGRLGLELGFYEHRMNSCHYYTEREEQVLETLDEFKAFKTPDCRLDDGKMGTVATLMEKSLEAIRHDEMPYNIMQDIDSTYYCDWIRMMAAYENERYGNTLYKPKYAFDDIETEWMIDWLNRLR